MLWLTQQLMVVIAAAVVLLIVMQPCPTSAHIFSKRKVIINSLEFDNCGSTFDPVRFIDVSVSTTDEGDLEIAGKFDAYERIQAPVKAVVTMHRRLLGLWTPVPFCYRRFGSCEFEDVCRYGRSDSACPALLHEHDVPCECPIDKGRYILPGAQFRVNGTRWAWMLSGDYRGSVKLSHAGRQIACYTARFSLDRLIN